MKEKTATHEVFNQFSEIDDYNLYTTDTVLKSYFEKNKQEFYDQELQKWGKKLGSAERFHNGDLANKNTPELKIFDNRGRRIDFIEFHPSWHKFMESCKNSGLIGWPFKDETEFRWSYAAAYFILQTQAEAGAL